LTPIKSAHETKLAQLKEFRDEYGHCNVPQRKHPLASWVNHLRHRKSGLSKELIRRLDEMCFDWAPYETEWEEGFLRLEAYKEKNGHCYATRAEDVRLGNFVSNMRSRRAGLPEEQIRRLDELGFDWDPYATAWTMNITKLKAYKGEGGHFHVTEEQDKELHHFVEKQRGLYKKGKLSPDRLQELSKIGFDFDWDSRANRWETNFSELLTFRDQYHHCNVPDGKRNRTKLGKWVSVQRAFRKKGMLSKNRIQRLDAIGFCWSLKN
jgi:hypothetical protein